MVTEGEFRRKGEAGAGAQSGTRAEEALRETQARLQTVVSAAPIVLFALDRDGVFTLSEGRGLDGLGLKPGEVVGQCVFELYADMPQIVEDNRRALKGEEFTSTVDVGGLTFEARYSPIRDKSGEVVGVIGVATDITEGRRVEQALRESEARYRELVEKINAVIFELSPYGRIRYISPAVEEMFGYRPSEVIGRYCVEFAHPEDLAVIVHSLQSGRPGGTQPAEFRVLSKSGKEVWVHGFARLIMKGDRVVGSRGVMTDVTERKRLEQAAQEAREELEDRVDALVRGNHYGLSFRELTVLHLLADGRSDKEIAALLSISPRTASKHVENILVRMKASSRTEAGVRAVRENLLAYGSETAR